MTRFRRNTATHILALVALAAALALVSTDLSAQSIDTDLPDGGHVGVHIGDSEGSVSISIPSIGFGFSDSFSFGSDGSGSDGFSSEGETSPLGAKSKTKKVLPLQALSTESRSANRGGGAESASRDLAASIAGGSSGAPGVSSAPLNYSGSYGFSAAAPEGQTGAGTADAPLSFIAADNAVPLAGAEFDVATSGGSTYSAVDDSGLVLVELPELGVFVLFDYEPTAAELSNIVEMIANQRTSMADLLTTAGSVVMPALQALELAGKAASVVLLVVPAGVMAAPSATLVALYGAVQLAKAMDDGFVAYQSQTAAGNSNTNAAYAGLAITATNVALSAGTGKTVTALSNKAWNAMLTGPLSINTGVAMVSAIQLYAWSIGDSANKAINDATNSYFGGAAPQAAPQ